MSREADHLKVGKIADKIKPLGRKIINSRDVNRCSMLELILVAPYSWFHTELISFKQSIWPQVFSHHHPWVVIAWIHDSIQKTGTSGQAILSPGGMSRQDRDLDNVKRNRSVDVLSISGSKCLHAKGRVGKLEKATRSSENYTARSPVRIMMVHGSMDTAAGHWICREWTNSTSLGEKISVKIISFH